jgi:putative FmdB family regulatory protein
LPTYEYACTACGHRLDAVQKFSDDPLTECPDCGGLLRKVYGAIGIVLKGSGFYKTDSRVSAGKAGGDSKGSDAKSGDSKSSDASSSSESKSSDSGSSGSSGSSGQKDSAKPSTGGDKPAKESRPAATTSS